MGSTANYVFLIVALPFAFWTLWTDLKYMKIRNITVLLMLAAVLVANLVYLPLDVFLWRLLGGVIVLAIGFVLFALVGIGGGDVKFAAVMALFIDHSDLARFLFMLSLFCLITVFIHRMIGKMKLAKPITENWESWKGDLHFPLGFALSSALIYYLAGNAFSI